MISDQVRSIQSLLGVTQDGLWGPKSQDALDAALHLASSGLPTSLIRCIQGLLGVAQDGVWGPESERALETACDASLRELRASAEPAQHGRIFTAPGFAFTVRVDLEDLIIDPAKVTAFGGSDDPQDDGATASGISTCDRPDILGCALPIRLPKIASLRNSPLPRLPWFTKVIFTDTDPDDPVPASVTTELIDCGPSGYTGHAGDLTVAAARHFDPRATARNFLRTLRIRIIGGARYVV